MCLGNRAEVSSHYINGQLRSVFENAQHCSRKHLNGLKPSASAVEYATCLAEFYGPGRHAHHHPSRKDLSFFATFGCPRIEFVCNHEVVLFLNLEEGHYNLDYTKTSPKRKLNENIESCTLAFRIPFSSHAIENFHCKAIDNADHYTTILHVLDMESAVFVAEHSNFPGVIDTSDEHSFYTKERKANALTHYLIKHYLPTLKRAGHHVLYSLPDFDNLTSTSAHIDYSVISTRALATDTLFGVRIEDVNIFLRGLWLQAAAFVDDHGHSADTVSKSILAELRTSPTNEIDDLHMHLYFGPLYVQALCKREVVLYLDVQDIHVHFGGFSETAKENLRDWKIAFIVDIVFEQVNEGSTRRIKLDLGSARFCEHLSVFGEHHDIEILTRIKTTLIQTITTYYMSILETSELTTIYNYDKSVHEDWELVSEDDHHHSGVIDVEGCTCEDEGSCGHTGCVNWGVIQRRILTHTHTNDFDVVTALTQGSINAHFKALWEGARRRLSFVSGKKGARTWESAELQLETCLADFSFVHPEHGEEVFFAASFSAPQVQLICNKDSHSVILYVHLTEGYLKTLGSGKSLQPGSHAHPFSNWRLAFEVDLKIIDSREDTMSSIVLTRLGLNKPSGLKQLVLALSSAKLNLSLSTVPGLLDGIDYRTIRACREALVYYIQTCYFPILKRAQHHVLYTIPQTMAGGHQSRHLLTSLRFEIVPFTYASGVRHLEGLFGRYRAIFERNTIVIMGMTSGRKMPKHSLPRDINWVCGYGQDVPQGMVYLSRKSFLESVLLERLEHINCETTIVPTFSGIKSGRWVLELAAWKDHKMKNDTECKWREVVKKENINSLEFEWKNRELWRYEHDDDFYNSGTYAIDCITHNVLSVPTNRSGKFVIRLKGVFKMYLKYEGSGKDWSSETTMTWSANFVFTSTASGLQVHMHPSSIVPDIRTTHITHGAPGHETQAQALEQLKTKFPDSIDFAVLLHDLKLDLEGMWAGVQVQSHELCVVNPVFSRRGDLVLELAVRGAHVENKTSHGGSRQLNGKGSVMSMNGGATPVGMNGNGNATNEHWFRQVVHKAGDALNVYSPSISRMSSSSKTSTTSLVSQETITRQSSSVQILSGSGEELGVVSQLVEEEL